MTGRDAARDELALMIAHPGAASGMEVKPDHCDHCRKAVVAAAAILASGYRKVTVTPEQIETAKQKVAENQLRRYESQHQADHLTWREFYDEADEDVRAAARAFGLSVAEDGGQ